MCSKAPHGTTPTLTSAIKISSQTATYINSRHYSLSWLITQSENKVSWHHKVSQGPTRSHKVAQGLTRSHKVSQGLKRSHKAPQGLTRSHKASQGLTRPHRVSRGDSQVCPEIKHWLDRLMCLPCVWSMHMRLCFVSSCSYSGGGV